MLRKADWHADLHTRLPTTAVSALVQTQTDSLHCNFVLQAPRKAWTSSRLNQAGLAGTIWQARPHTGRTFLLLLCGTHPQNDVRPAVGTSRSKGKATLHTACPCDGTASIHTIAKVVCGNRNGSATRPSQNAQQAMQPKQLKKDMWQETTATTRPGRGRRPWGRDGRESVGLSALLAVLWLYRCAGIG